MLTVAHQAPLSMEFSRQEYWSGLPCPPPGDLPNPGIKPRSPTLQEDSLSVELLGKPKEYYIDPEISIFLNSSCLDSGGYGIALGSLFLDKPGLSHAVRKREPKHWVLEEQVAKV